MKRNLSLLLTSIFLLTGCGGDTSDWPVIDLPFTSNDVVSITMDFVSKNSDDIFTDVLRINDPERILAIYTTVDNMPIREKIEKSIETKSYFIRLSIDFLFDDSESSIYRLVYYEYNISDGKIMLDNGEVHWLPGNFSLLYYRNVNP